MLKVIRKWLIIIALVGVAYGMMSNHIIFKGTNFKLLPKSELTFEYTFYSLSEKEPEEVLRIEPLRYAGIGYVMVDFGMITEDELLRIEEQIDSEY
jgi:hypothetical protein